MFSQMKHLLGFFIFYNNFTKPFGQNLYEGHHGAHVLEVNTCYINLLQAFELLQVEDVHAWGDDRNSDHVIEQKSTHSVTFFVVDFEVEI